MNEYIAYARAAAKRAGIDPDIFVRQIYQESRFNPNAKSPAGAIGIAQFMPGTAEQAGIDPTDPYASLDAAAELMAQRLKQYGGRWDLALAAYNAGAGAVEKYGGVPPYEETQQYIAIILGPSGTGIGAGTGDTSVGTPGQGGSNVVAPQQPSYRPSYPAGAGAEPNRNQISYNMDLLQKALGPYANVTRLPPRKDAVGLPTETEGYRYQWANGLYLDIYGNPETPNEESGTALDWLEKQANKTQTSGNTDDVTLQDGSVWRVDTSDPVNPRPLYQVKPAPAQAQPKYQMGSSSGPLIPIFDPTTGKTSWRPNPNYNPADRTQTELENERLRRSMQPLGAQQMKDLAAQQQQIQALLASGDIDVETANKLMDAARKNISATMRGTTLFQQEQADEENRQQRLSRAGQLIGTKLAQSSGLAGNFLSSALSGAGNAMMPAGKTTLGLDPLILARNYSASQGGDELSRLAALLTGGAGGGQPEMSEEEYQQRMAGLQGAK